MCCCIPRKMVPLDATCHHVATGVTPRLKRTVKPADCSGRLCAFFLCWLWHKTDRGQPFYHGRLCAVGYDSVGFLPVRFPDLYNRPTHNRPYLNEYGRFSRFYIKWAVGYIWMWSVFWQQYGNNRSVLSPCGRFSGLLFKKIAPANNWASIPICCAIIFLTCVKKGCLL